MTLLVTITSSAREIVGFCPPARLPTIPRRTRRVEEGRGAGPTGSRWFPFPAHQTGRARFEHPAFRQTSPTSSRKWPQMHIAEPQHAQFPKHDRVRETRTAPRMHLMAVPQEIPYALVDVMVDRSIGL